MQELEAEKAALGVAAAVPSLDVGADVDMDVKAPLLDVNVDAESYGDLRLRVFLLPVLCPVNAEKSPDDVGAQLRTQADPHQRQSGTQPPQLPGA